MRYCTPVMMLITYMVGTQYIYCLDQQEPTKPFPQLTSDSFCQHHHTLDPRKNLIGLQNALQNRHKHTYASTKIYLNPFSHRIAHIQGHTGTTPLSADVDHDVFTTNAVAISPDNKLLATGVRRPSSAGTLHLYTLDDESTPSNLQYPIATADSGSGMEGTLSVSFSLQGDLIATGAGKSDDTNQTIRLYKINRDESGLNPDRPLQAVGRVGYDDIYEASSVAISPCGQFLAAGVSRQAGSHRGSTLIFQICREAPIEHVLRLVTECNTDFEQTSSVAFCLHKDHLYLATGSTSHVQSPNATTRIFWINHRLQPGDTFEPERDMSFIGAVDPDSGQRGTMAVAFCQCGTYMATGVDHGITTMGTTRVYQFNPSAQQFNLLAITDSDSDGTCALGFSGCGRFLVSGINAPRGVAHTRLHRFRVGPTTPERTLHCIDQADVHAKRTTSVAISLNGRYLVTGKSGGSTVAD